MSESEQWYTNKELHSMMMELGRSMEKTNLEMSKTQVMIRDYNGLREKIDWCEHQLSQGIGASRGGRDMWGYIVGAVGVLLAVASFLNR